MDRKCGAIPWLRSYEHLRFCGKNFSATVLSGNMALNKTDKPSQERKEKDGNTFFKVHHISASVTESDYVRMKF